MKQQFILLLLLFPFALMAQNEYSHYNWKTLPDPVVGDSLKSVNGAIILLERRITEVYINSQDLFEEIYVYHKKVKVESHDAIDNFNKIYIPMNGVLEMLDISARFTSPDGKTTVLSKNNIKKIENLENKGNYNSFVIEGAEVGGQIEYYYVLRKSFNPYGGYYVQDETPRAKVEIIFSYPEKISYMYQYNNGFPEFSIDKSKEGRIIERADIKGIAGVPEEKYAYYNPNLMSVDFTLSYNRYNSYIRVYSWAKACDNIYRNNYEIVKKERSAVKKLLTSMAIVPNGTEGTVRQIENWIKKNFSVDKNFEGQPSLVENIKLKQCNYSEISKLYIAIFNELNIKFENIKTGDLSVEPFRPEFDAFNYLDYTLFYFPEIKKYLTPEDNSYRIGLIPGEFQGAYALYMKPISYNESLKTLGYDVKKIPVTPCTQNADSLFINVTLDIENNILKTNTKRYLFGDFARTFQSILHLMDESKKKEFVESLFEMGQEQTEVLRLKYENSEPENIAVKPLIWDLDLQSKSLIQVAGKDLLIKIGETIGRQSELYQETQRVFPVQIGILHDYYRVITVKIPEGYRVENLLDLNMHIEMKSDNKTSCIFTSEASLENNTLTIKSKEYYLESYYPATRYDEFRKVINAAADFNKKILLLRKI